MKRFLLLLLSALAVAPLPVHAGWHDDKPAERTRPDSHRLRELRLRQALESGDLSASEVERWRTHQRWIDKHRSPSAAPDRLFPEDDARHYWRDKRRKSKQRD